MVHPITFGIDNKYGHQFNIKGFSTLPQAANLLSYSECAMPDITVQLQTDVWHSFGTTRLTALLSLRYTSLRVSRAPCKTQPSLSVSRAPYHAQLRAVKGLSIPLVLLARVMALQCGRGCTLQVCISCFTRKILRNKRVIKLRSYICNRPTAALSDRTDLICTKLKWNNEVDDHFLIHKEDINSVITELLPSVSSPLPLCSVAGRTP